MIRSRLVWLSLSLGLLPALPAAAACPVRDFLAMPLPSASPRPAYAIALELSYGGLRVNEAAGTLTLPDGASLPLGADPGRPEAARLKDASILEQFSQPYPLAFDLERRLTPWFDPGRFRNDAFFRGLLFDSEKATAASLVTVPYPGATKARFAMTTRHCVASQLEAALKAIAAEGPAMDRYFTEIGGSFNWRKIAGTERLSSHSFGTAVDFNTKLGGYWRWSGAKEGQVGSYDNHYPEALVRHMERHGFIWGGKWHHFDGMHFEYRPELILHARLSDG